MRRYKIIIMLLLAIFLFALTACGGTRLDRPVELMVDSDELILSWSDVEGNRGYVVEIRNMDTGITIERPTSRELLSLSSIGLSEGDYALRVKALGDDRVSRDSRWSDELFFHRDNETGCTYVLINNDAEFQLTRVNAATGDVVLEDVFRGKKVTSIAQSAFRGSSRVTSIVVGQYVESIGDSAFFNCSKLTSVTIPDSVKTLGVAAFQSCRMLTTVTLSKNISTIGANAFAYCSALTEISLPSNIADIGSEAFTDCSSLTSIVIPDSVSTIGERAFAKNASLKEVTFGSSLTTIANYAFSQCYALTDVNFNEDSALTSIGQNAFANCYTANADGTTTGLEEIELPEGVTTIGGGAFIGCEKLTNVVIPSTVTSIGSAAFNATKIYIDAMTASAPFVYAGNWIVASNPTVIVGITDLTNSDANLSPGVRERIADGTVGIADYVFYNYPALNRVVFPSSMRIIGDHAFANCVALSAVVMTYSRIVLIDDYAFSNCTILSNLVMSPVLEKIGSYAFNNCSLVDNNADDPYALVPESVNTIGTEAFRNTRLFENASDSGIVYAGRWVVGTTDRLSRVVNLDTQTIGIADYAFYQNTRLAALIGLEGVSYVGRGAFRECINLSAAYFGVNMREIRPYTFMGCSSLINVSFQTYLHTIGRYAFYNCVMLNEIDLSGTRVTTVDAYAFYGCTNVKRIKLGQRLETIGDYAFYKCMLGGEGIEAIVDGDALIDDGRNLILPDSLTSIGRRAFGSGALIENIYFGSGLTAIGDHAFNGCSSLRSINLPDNIVSIGNYAFYKCTSVEVINFSESLVSIGDYAFFNLEKVSNLNIPDSVVSIGRYAFKGMLALDSVFIKSTVQEIGINAFYGCRNLTIYTDYAQLPARWSARWNSSYRPVVWGCTLSEDESYIVSVTITATALSNPNATGGITSPEREGYVFIGWSTREGGVAEYAAAVMNKIPVGTTLYAVWVEA